MSIRLHTPGPWTVDYTDDHLRLYAGDLLIVEVNGSTEHIKVRGLDEETTQANAWLIAAAPYAPDGVTLVTATPKPTEHLTVGVEDPRTLTDAQRAAATEHKWR